MAGVAWLLRHAAAHGFVEVEPDEPLADIDATLRERMVSEMRAGRFDFLHGALGCASYLLAAGGDGSSRALIAALDALETHAVVDEGRVWWRNPAVDDYEETRGGISLGLSHGVPSVIAVLAQYLARGVGGERAGRLLDGGVRYVLSQERATGTDCFPAFIGAGLTDMPSRLAWCYGDPGIAAALWHAGRARARADWRDKALAVFARGAARRDADDTRVTDVSLCHGAAGLALIFARMHHETGRPDFADAARHWLSATLAFVPHTTDTTLLTGLAGAGLTLMALAGDHAPAWDRALLLS
jgi:hypothetical protein